MDSMKPNMKINLEKLQPNTTYKNYKDMCVQLEMDVKSSTNSKNAQYKELERFCKYYKDGHKIVIEEVYTNPLDKVENRGGSRYTIYGDIVQLLIIDLLAQCNGHLSISRSKLMSAIGMTNENYNGCRENLQKLSKYLNINISVIFDFYNTTNSSFKGIIERALAQLEDKRILFSEKIIKVNRKGEHSNKKATLEEKQEIMKIERKILDNMGYADISSVRMSKDWNVFKNEANRQMYEKLNLNYYYTAYDITINNDYVENERSKLKSLILEELVREDNKEMLNCLIRDSIDSSALKRVENSFTASKKLSRVRCNAKYIGNIKSISDVLIKIDTPNIVSEVMEIEIITIPQDIIDEIEALL